MTSRWLTTSSAVALASGGLALLFVPDLLLPRLIPGYPPAGAWLGQLVAAAWLALACLNWLNRSTVIGGIHGRRVLMPNLTMFFLTTIVLAKAMLDTAAPIWLLPALVPSGFLMLAYGWLFRRGPFARDLL